MKYIGINWLAVFVMALVFSACGGDGTSKTRADEPMPASNVNAESSLEYYDLAYATAFDKTQDGKSVQIEGYLQLPDRIYTTSGSTQIDVYERPHQSHGRNISATVKTGSCNNCMESLPENYKLSDLKIKTNDGTSAGANQRVRLKGTLSVNESSSSENGFMVGLRVNSIEALPEIEIDYGQIQALKIDKTNLLDTTLVNVMSYAEGKLSIPSMLFMQNDIALDMAYGDKNLYVNFVFGTGPNQIEDIPENYSKADFKIHDAKGKLINLNKPVRVWGIRSQPGSGNSGFLYVEHLEQ